MRFVLALLLCACVNAAWAAPVAEDPLERQMLDIAKDLRCAVCQNQPVSESNADLARDMRAIIREQLEAGKSREEIVDYFVARYGEYVLLKPPYRGTGFPLWIVPLVLLLVLVRIHAWVMRTFGIGWAGKNGARGQQDAQGCFHSSLLIASAGKEPTLRMLGRIRQECKPGVAG